MTPEQFFTGETTGFGVVRSRRGKVLRRFTLEMRGEWSPDHRALHLDETYTYVGGGSFQRRWAIHTDEQGFILGHDALEVARLRGRQRGADFRIVFDRRKRPLGRFDPPQVVDFIEAGPGRAILFGRARLFGLTIATIHAALRRRD